MTLYESSYVGLHIPCPDCGSSDALVLFKDHSNCFSCHKQRWINHREFDGLEEFTCEEEFYDYLENYKEGKNMTTTLSDTENPVSAKGKPLSWERELIKERNRKGEFFNTQKDSFVKKGPLKHRGISAETMKFFDVLVWLDEERQVSRTIFQHKDDLGNVVAQKIKTRTGEHDKKDYASIGATKQMRFFGQWLFPAGTSKKLTITEGEEDALAVYEMNGGYPVVSIPNGAQSVEKTIEEQWDWLRSFEEIILCFDSDEAGQTAVSKFAKNFPERTKVINMGKYKDANNLLMAEQGKAKSIFNKLFWAAQTYAPKGIITGQALKSIALSDSPVPECYPYPWEGLNALTFGWRKGEVWIWTADKKVGKTTVLKEVIHYSMKDPRKLKFGVLFLEDSLERNTKAFVGTEGNKPFHIPDCQYTREEFEEAVDRIDWDRLFLFDKKSLTGSFEKIIGKVEELIFVNKADMIVLDNLMALASLANDVNEQERQKLNDLISRLVALAEKEHVHISVVSHLNDDGKIYGTRHIGKIAHGVINLSRDKKHKIRAMRNKTLVWVEDNRFCGYEGEACWLVYDKETGRLSEEPFEAEDEDDNDELPLYEDKPVFDSTPMSMATF